MVRPDPRDLVTADGFRLAAHLFRPTGTVVGGAVLAPAMGVDQDYYHALAGWLASRGVVAATFDYRGTGRSRHAPLRGFETDILEWARSDCPAVLDELAAHTGAAPITWIGHSLGGQIFPLLPNRERVAKLVTVAAGSGYWLENAPALRRRVAWLWYFVAPVSMALWGYFPGKRFGMVGDLPLGVMKQWRRWCLDRRYLVGAEGPEVGERVASLALPITAISFADDEMMSWRNIESLHGEMTAASVRHVRLDPVEAGVERIGHFGFFRLRFAENLWPTHLLPELATGDHRSAR